MRPFGILLTVAALAGAPAAQAQEPQPSPSPVASPTPAPPEAPPAAEPPTEVVPPGAEGAGGPSGPLPVYGPPSSKVFNPDIAVIGNFLGAAGTNEVDPPPSLAMDEVELALQAIVDPYARADFFLALGPEGVEVEEAFITFPTLPGGLLMKVGKLKAAFGKVNTYHAHQLSWIDRPLVNVNLLGGEEGLADSGISVARLIPNPLLFLELTGEVFRGESGVFQAPTRGDLAYGARLRAYHDLGESANIDVGSSFAYGHVAPDATTRLIGIDATLRYRPLRRAIYRRFLARTEWVWRRDPAGFLDLFGSEEADPPASGSGITARGAYLSAEYQFARRWFAGARLDWSERPEVVDEEDKGGSLLLTYWPSEFSQVRGQYRRIRYAEGPTSNEVLFQFLFSIGAHGAHTF
jgi:hypothetical protein